MDEWTGGYYTILWKWLLIKLKPNCCLGIVTVKELERQSGVVFN